MAEVQDHMKVFGFLHQLPAKLRKAAFFQAAGKVAAVSRSVSAAPGQAQSTDACGIKAVEQEAGGNGLCSLKGEKKADPSGFGGPEEVVCAGAEHEKIRGFLDLAVEGRDLLHGHRKGPIGQVLAVHKNGGDDTGHAALLEGGIVTPPDDLALAFFPAGGHVHENIIMSVNDVFHSYSFLSILIVRSRRR